MKTLYGRAAARLLAAALVSLGIAPPTRAASPPAPAVFAVDGETRVRRADDPSLHGRPLPASGGEVLLHAFPGETPAFQLVLAAGATPISHVRLDLPALGGARGVIVPDAFREHYLAVTLRSNNERHPDESLGWTAGARPRDADMLGDVPDALIPTSVDAKAVAGGPEVPAAQTGAFWIDLPVPESTPAGDYSAVASVDGDGRTLAAFRLRVRVSGPVLPYRAASAFVFYEPERLGKRLGAANAGSAERQLWQLLHAHRLDAIAPLADAETGARLRAAYDGTLFRPEAGYHGPGIGLAPAVVGLGTYGAFGDPSPEAFARLDGVLASLPLAALAGSDVFLYAIDERCASPRAGGWRRLLAERTGGTGMWRGARVLVGQTCYEPPARQDVDVALLPAEAFARATTNDARAAGRRGWIYNGRLPWSGTLMLDAAPRGLTANGWIAAATGIERWFYWESTFWDDDNRGGRGAIDPFVTAESFHNTDGDTALGDGLLVYPGTQQPPFSAHSLGRAEVLPSLRLKALRRGLEDAGLIALAARERPADVARLVAEALPAALDEAPVDRPASWEGAPRRFSEARAALRALVTRMDPISAAEVRAALGDLAARRARAIPAAPPPPPTSHRSRARAIALSVLAAAALAAAVVAGRRVQRRSKR